MQAGGHGDMHRFKGIAMLIFLDFDGVMHPFGLDEHSPDLFCCSPILENLLAEFPAVDVVVSTSWRKVFSLEEICCRLPSGIASRIVGETPERVGIENLPDVLWAHPREAECWTWMRRNRRSGERWLAIDDEPWHFSAECQNLYLTDAKVGLVFADVARLRARMAVADGEDRLEVLAC